jgi:hypothetical protein
VYSPGNDGHGIYLLDAFGNRELLYRDPDIGCLGPVPVKPRPAPPIIPATGKPARLTEDPAYHVVGDEHAIDPACTGTSENAVVGLVNVYDSLYSFPEGVKIVALRIVHLLPKSTPLIGDKRPGAYLREGQMASPRSISECTPCDWRSSLDAGRRCRYGVPRTMLPPVLSTRTSTSWGIGVLVDWGVNKPPSNAHPEVPR